MVAKTATSLRKGLAILDALAAHDVDGRGLTVTALTALVGVDKSQVSRSLKVLYECGVVDRDPESLNYKLGWHLFALAARSGDARLLAEAQPVLRRLVAALGERAHLSVLLHGDVLTVLSESPGHAVQAAGWIGRTTPVHCTSSGRALLFDHTRHEVAAVVEATDATAGTANAPRSADELWKRVARDITRGYSLVDEEFEEGLVAVAAPVRDYRGQIVAAVNISAPKFRFTNVVRGGAAVSRAAADLSRALGYRAADDRPRLIANGGDE